MKIKNWNHAIDLTIQSYEYAIKNDVTFSEAKRTLLPKDWGKSCPLCMYAISSSQSEEEKCDNCLWIKLEGRPCRENYDEAINRLKRWKLLLNKEDKMKTFQELVNKQMEELGYKEKVEQLEKMLLDFGFVKNNDIEYRTGVALKLPDNPLGVRMYVFIDYRGFVEGKYYTFEYNKSVFRFLLDEDSLEFIFSGIQSPIKKMLRCEG